VKKTNNSVEEENDWKGIGRVIQTPFLTAGVAENSDIGGDLAKKERVIDDSESVMTCVLPYLQYCPPNEKS